MLNAIHESNQNINRYNNNHIDNDEQTRSDEQMLIIRGVGVEPGYLYSWLRRFDAARGVKTPVLGFCRFDTGTLEVRVLIVDDEKAIQGIWCLSGKPCRTARPGQKSPQILATNYDLS